MNNFFDDKLRQLIDYRDELKQKKQRALLGRHEHQRQTKWHDQNVEKYESTLEAVEREILKRLEEFARQQLSKDPIERDKI